MGNVCKECGSEKKPKKEIGLVWLIFVGVVEAILLTAGLILIFGEQPDKINIWVRLIFIVVVGATLSTACLFLIFAEKPV